jgi:hypothetical protein
MAVRQSMVEDSSRTERFSMRFMALDEQQLQALQRALPGIELKVRQSEVGTTAVFDLSEDVDYEPLCAFLDDARIDSKNHSVWVSVVTSSDHSGVSVPDYVLRLIRRTQCGLDFSFVSVGGDFDESAQLNNERVEVAFVPSELAFLCNVINESLEAVEGWEFQTRTGESRTNATAILSQLRRLYDDAVNRRESS